MRDYKLMLDFIQELSYAIYGKQVFSYDFDSNSWYSRYHSKNIEFEEVLEWLKVKTLPCFYES